MNAPAASSDLPVALLTPTAEADALHDLLLLAMSLLETPIGAIIARREGDFRVLTGHDFELPALSALPRDHLFVRCWEQHTPLLVLPDLPASTRSAIRFHTGLALRDTDDQIIGLLALCDRQPRPAPSPAQLDALQRLARTASCLLQQQDVARRAAIIAQAGHHTREAVLITDRHGRIHWHNVAARHLFGDDIIGRLVPHLIPLHLQSDQDALRRWFNTPDDPHLSHPIRIAAPDGRLRLLKATQSPWQHGMDRGSIVILRDVTDAIQQRAQLDRLAHFDPLTGLPNRNALLAALDAHPDWGLALIGIDRFKWINESLGHGLGDRVLQALAERLQKWLEGEYCLSRVEGDVFAIACPDVRLEASGPEGLLLADLQEMLEQPLRIRGHAIQLEISMGVAQRADVHAGGDLLACADLALQRAKTVGGHQICHYQPSMREEALARRDLDLELRRAFAQGEFELHYQPQVSLETGRICGAEALLRWRHPTRGLVPAYEFIDVLTHSPLGADVGAWVLRRACQDAITWPEPISISINLFPAQLRDTLARDVLEALMAVGLPAQRLELEITENIALTRDSTAARDLAELRKHGVNLAFDDFGTGYASLSLLHRFRIDRVKIDRSFVEGMLHNGEDAAIVRWTVMLARALGIRVVAEGVERSEQATSLQALGCDEAQGYLYAPALDAATFLQRLRAQTENALHG